MIEIKTPISDEVIEKLNIGDMIYLSGDIFCGRDAVLPKIVKRCETDTLLDIDLNGGVVFHTAVSEAGIGPTSSNKLEIEASILPLSKNGVKLHLGKGQISERTIQGLKKYNSVYAVIPPVSALLKSKTFEKKCIAYPELGMEAFYKINVDKYPVIIAAAKGKSIY